MTFRIKRGDTRPALEVICGDEDGNPRDLSNATAQFHMEDQDGNVTIDAAATITNASEGKVAYEWASGDTDTIGLYGGEFEITYSDGKSETFPNYGSIDIEIVEDIA